MPCFGQAAWLQGTCWPCFGSMLYSFIPLSFIPSVSVGVGLTLMLEFLDQDKQTGGKEGETGKQLVLPLKKTWWVAVPFPATLKGLFWVQAQTAIPGQRRSLNSCHTKEIRMVPWFDFIAQGIPPAPTPTVSYEISWSTRSKERKKINSKSNGNLPSF